MPGAARADGGGGLGSSSEIGSAGPGKRSDGRLFGLGRRGWRAGTAGPRTGPGSGAPGAACRMPGRSGRLSGIGGRATFSTLESRARLAPIPRTKQAEDQANVHGVGGDV